MNRRALLLLLRQSQPDWGLGRARIPPRGACFGRRARAIRLFAGSRRCQAAVRARAYGRRMKEAANLKQPQFSSLRRLISDLFWLSMLARIWA